MIITAKANDTGLTANYETCVFIRACEVEQPRLFRVRVANYACDHLCFRCFLIYFSVLIFASAGFTVLSEMVQNAPIRTVSGIRPSSHRICIRRVETPHFQQFATLIDNSQAEPLLQFYPYFLQKTIINYNQKYE